MRHPERTSDSRQPTAADPTSHLKDRSTAVANNLARASASGLNPAGALLVVGGSRSLDRVSELPPDPDLDELPPEIAEHDGLLHLRAVDPATGEVHKQPISRAELAAAFADVRRAGE